MTMKLNKHTSLKHYEGWIYCRAAIVLEHLRVINWQLSSQCLLIKWNWYFWKGEKLSAHPSSSFFLLPHLARKRKRKSFFFVFFRSSLNLSLLAVQRKWSSQRKSLLTLTKATCISVFLHDHTDSTLQYFWNRLPCLWNISQLEKCQVW